MSWTLWPFVLGLSLAAPSMPPHGMREEALDPAVKTHMVAVAGFPGLITTIRLPDSFEASNVLCGECIDLQATEPVAAAADGPSAADPRNWIIDKHPRERSIHVRPAKLPSAANPVSAFSTNVFVTLDGGHAINISLSLYRADAAAKAPQRAGADAVVTLTLPGQATLSGRLQQAEAALVARHQQATQEAAHALVLERLLGEVHCRRTAWGRPHRTDRTVVRIEQACVAKSASPTFWVVVDIENRDAAQLSLEQLSLEPQTQQRVCPDPVAYLLERRALPFGAHTRGVVSASLKAGEPWPEAWRLQVTPASNERRPVVIDVLF